LEFEKWTYLFIYYATVIVVVKKIENLKKVVDKGKVMWYINMALSSWGKKVQKRY